MEARRDTKYVKARKDCIGGIMVRGVNGQVQDYLVRENAEDINLFELLEHREHGWR